jgi:hypothetical protein
MKFRVFSFRKTGEISDKTAMFRVTRNLETLETDCTVELDANRTAELIKF